MSLRALPALFPALFLASQGAFAGQLGLGAQFQTWTTNVASTTDGQYFLVPLTLSIDPVKDVNLYAQGEFADGQTTDPINGTQNLSDFTDTVVGGKIGFKSFSFDSFVDLGFNLPAGNQAWETQTEEASIPAEFVDYPYQGRGFGLSCIYGIALPEGPTQYGVGLGYFYSGALNPNANSVENLKLGDSIFLSVNRVTTFEAHQTQTLSLSGYYFMPTQQDGQDTLWMGSNLNLSYSWTNPSALSLEAGVQYFLPAQTAVNGQWMAEAHNSLGPRFYLDPSWAFGNFLLSGRVKWVMANGYDPGDSSYNGGGLLLGIEPSYKFNLDRQSDLKISASYDNITADGAGADAQGNRVNILYNRWTCGANYEIKL
jgi:hypothetical protein